MDRPLGRASLPTFHAEPAPGVFEIDRKPFALHERLDAVPVTLVAVDRAEHLFGRAQPVRAARSALRALRNALQALSN